MIFSKIFKKIKDTTVNQKNTASKDDPKKLLPQKSGNAAGVQIAEKTLKKTKLHKKNKALNTKSKKKRSGGVIHTKKTFHRKTRRPTEEQVNIYDTIKRPVITEKAANKSEQGVYTFIVRKRANKHDVADAIEVLYGVRPRKVRIAKRPSGKKRIRIPGKEGEYGMTTEKKKAYVFLREGDTIKLT